MHLLHIYFLYIHSPPPKKKKPISVSPRVSSPSHKTPKKNLLQKVPNKTRKSENRPIFAAPTNLPSPPPVSPRRMPTIPPEATAPAAPNPPVQDRSTRGAARQARDEGDGACGACGDAWVEVWNGWTGGGWTVDTVSFNHQKRGGACIPLSVFSSTLLLQGICLLQFLFE